jgi:hypothetical protein
MIKNYTSAVPVERTIMRIEQALIEGGAIGIMKNYTDGCLEAISFQIPSPGKGPVAIRLPANVQAVYDILRKAMKRPRLESLKRLQAQAERTAWKLVQDWVEVQMAMVNMQQAEILQVFFPYLWDGRQTLFAAYKQGNFKLLEKPKAHD